MDSAPRAAGCSSPAVGQDEVVVARHDIGRIRPVDVVERATRCAVFRSGQYLEFVAIHAGIGANAVVPQQMFIGEQIGHGGARLASGSICQITAVGVGIDSQDAVAPDSAQCRTECNRDRSPAYAALDAKNPDLVGVRHVSANSQVQTVLIEFVG